MQTVTAAVRRLADVDAEVALIDARGETLARPWRALHAGGRRVAGGLHALGVRPGERVALMFDTSEELLHALLGCWLLGAVPTPVYPPVRLGRLAEWTARTAAMLDLAEARALLLPARALPWVGDLVARARLPLGVRTLAGLPRAEPPEPAVAADALGLVQFSSGTTGAPKAVALTHGALVAQVRCIASGILAAYPDYAATGVGCGWLPLYHDMGLIGLFLTPLLFGRPVALMSPQRFLAQPAAWLDAIAAHGATVSAAPSFAYALCAERVTDEQIARLDLSRWRVALNGAEPIHADTMRRFAARLAPAGFDPAAMTPVYGLSEAALAVTFSSVARPFTATRFDRAALARGEARPAPDDEPDAMELVSCGHPLPGCAVEVRVDGAAAHGRVGRLWVRSPSLLRGYLGDEAATAAVLVDGWLDTGDRALLHDGALYLLGRDRDVLILRGENHDPTPLERAVDALPGARAGCAAAVSFRPEDHPTEVLVLLVEHARDASDALRRDLAARAARRVAELTGLQPDWVEVLPPGALPRTSSGKIRRQEALRRLQEGSLGAPDPVNRRFLAARALASGVGWARRWLR
jgi:acyl-CoA synthetase (AMP-forming)/AMP-acid ligase II